MKRYVKKELCDTCNGQYWCVHDCVTSFLQESKSENNCVEFKERGYCIDCGHCNAICPQGAIITLPVMDKMRDNLLEFFAMKRTVRNYNKEKQIPRDIADIILQAAQSAPSEKNRSTVRICMIKEQLPVVFLEAIEILKKQVEKVGPLHPQYQYILDLHEKKAPVFWGAEYAVVMIGKPQYSVDAALAAERMQLMAFSHGISSGYNGNLTFAINNSNVLREKLSMGKQEEALVSFALGYSDIEYHSPYISSKKKISFI